MGNKKDTSVKNLRPGCTGQDVAKRIRAQGGSVDWSNGSSHGKAKDANGQTCGSIPNHELRDGILKAIVAGLVAHGFNIFILMPAGTSWMEIIQKFIAS